MNQQQHKTRKRRKGPGDQTGEWKMAVRFIVHKSPSSFYYYKSKVWQDRRNNSFTRRMMAKIEHGDWKGKVERAMLYHREQLVMVYTDWNPIWHKPE